MPTWSFPRTFPHLNAGNMSEEAQVNMQKVLDQLLERRSGLDFLFVGDDEVLS